VKIYNVNDKVWYATCESRQIRKICPVCFGEREVTLILGNKERVTLECDYCGKGCESALGYIEEYEWITSPDLKTITRVNVKISTKGETREYYSDHWCLCQEDMFDSEEKARQRASEKSTKHAEEEATRGNHVKNLSNKSYSWKAGYWTQMIKRCRDDAERYEKYVTFVKSKVRISE